MMKSCAQFLSLSRETGGDVSRGNPVLKQGFVKVVHRGGREELYCHEVSASQLMEKYPGTCVARPEVFKSPHESVLWPEEKLLLGQKYFVVPATAVRRLQRKQQESSEWDSVAMDPGGTDFEESVSSAKDFYIPTKGRSPKKSLPRKGVRRKKPFVPPLPKARLSYRGLAWEPSLTSVQELSP